jgi:hypothetical protein
MDDNIIASWKTNIYAKADAQTVAQEIMSIGDKDDVRPQQIVEYAKNENTELHKCFTWNNHEASEKWRLHEARDIVTQLVIVKVNKESGKKEPTDIRVFYKTDASHSTGYKPTTLIMKKVDEYEKLLNMAKTELKWFRKKYSNLSELEKVFEAIDEL